MIHGITKVAIEGLASLDRRLLAGGGRNGLLKRSLLAASALAAGCTGVGHFADTEHQNLTDWLFHRRHTHHLERPIEENSMFALAQDLTRLEDQIRRDGSITVKTPDVWGESNLVHLIQEYDSLMKEAVDDFRFTLQGTRSVGDFGTVQGSTALGFGAAPEGDSGGDAAADEASTASLAATEEDGGDPPAATTTAPISVSANFVDIPDDQMTSFLEGFVGRLGETPMEVEPNELLRQRSSYIRVNQGLRLENMGGDNVRAAGYALYKFRIPVSVLPGRETSEGYSAVATLRAKPRIDEASLRNAVRRMTAVDVADFVVYEYRPSEETLRDGTVVADKFQLWSVRESFGGSGLANFAETSGDRDEKEAKGIRSADGANDGSSPASPVPGLGPSDLDPAEKERQAREKLEEIYVSIEKNRLFVEFAPRLAALGALFNSAPRNSTYRDVQIDAVKKEWKGLAEALFTRRRDDNFDPLQTSWLVAAQAAITDARLKHLIEDLYQRGEIGEETYALSREVYFFAPELAPEATLRCWRELIEAAFPVHVFALDPDVEEQNILGTFQRQREMQMALAVGVSRGFFGMEQRLAASRQLALEQADIDLNRVVVGFSHGNDTFGWYFHPRTQAPPVESSNVEFLLRTVWATGPTDAYDRRHRRLEPGIRECEALIVMPSFLTHVDFEVTTNWEKIAHPGVTKRSYEEMIDLGRQLQCARTRIGSISDAECFRPGDLERLASRFDQLEKMLGLQTHAVTVPYEFDQGATKLFSQGDEHLRPRLRGFYGVKFLREVDVTDPKGEPAITAEFFIDGLNFHPALTHVIVGGRESHSLDPEEVEVINRNLIRVTVRRLDKTLTKDGKADIYVATPGGLSQPLPIEFAAAKKEPPTGFAFAGGKDLLWRAQWRPLQPVQYLHALPDTIALIHTETNRPLLPAGRAGEVPLALVRIFAQDADKKKYKFDDGSGAPPEFRQSNPFSLVFDTKDKLYRIPVGEMCGEIERLMFASPPQTGGKNFTLVGEIWVKFDAWPTEKLITALQIAVDGSCPCPTPIIVERAGSSTLQPPIPMPEMLGPPTARPMPTPAPGTFYPSEKGFIPFSDRSPALPEHP